MHLVHAGGPVPPGRSPHTACPRVARPVDRGGLDLHGRSPRATSVDAAAPATANTDRSVR
jgi:hypothetical protein